MAARADREKTYRSAAEVNRAVFPLIEKSRACGKPLFLFVNYMDAHSPVNPPPPYDRLYPGKDETFTAARLSEIAERVKRREIPLSRRDRQHLLSQYDGAIAYLDTQIGLLMTGLRASGLFDNSLIVITSDHGEAFGEKGLMGHGVSVDQNQVHVPLLIRYPNAGRRGNVGETVSTLDVAPTILTFLGFPAPDEMEGGSLLRRETLTATFPISESFPDKELSDLDPRFQRIEQAIFSGPLKLVVATNGERDLWNLARDPLEEDNLYRKDDPACLSLQQRLKRFLERSARIPTHKAKPDQDTLERLRSLGYLH